MVKWTENDRYLAREMSHLLVSEGKLAAARTILEGLVHLDASDAYAHRALGFVYRRAGETKLAVVAFERALRLDRSDAVSALHLAELHALLGNRSAAQEFAARALVLADAGAPAMQARARAVVAVVTQAR